MLVGSTSLGFKPERYQPDETLNSISHRTPVRRPRGVRDHHDAPVAVRCCRVHTLSILRSTRLADA
eukprot:2092828-Rhodomonas_salina.2